MTSDPNHQHGFPSAEERFRDPTSFAEDLRRLEAHYVQEAARLQAEAADALEASRACRQWRANVQQQLVYEIRARGSSSLES